MIDEGQLGVHAEQSLVPIQFDPLHVRCATWVVQKPACKEALHVGEHDGGVGVGADVGPGVGTGVPTGVGVGVGAIIVVPPMKNTVNAEL